MQATEMTHNTDLKNKISWQIEILKRYDSYLNSTNTKASLLLAFCAALIAMIAYNSSRIISMSSNPLYVICCSFLIVTTISLILISSIYSINSIFPNVKTNNKKSLISFVDVCNYHADEYSDALFLTSDKEFLLDLCGQSNVLAKIANQKFELLAKAVDLLKSTIKIILFTILVIFLFFIFNI